MSLISESSLIKIPLISNDKKPKISEWQYLEETPESALFKNSNVGLLIGNQFLVINVENNGLKTWNKWIKKFGEPNTPKQKTPSDGFHYLFKNPSFITKKIIKLKIDGGSVCINVLVGSCFIPIEPSKIDNQSYKWIKHYINTPLADVPDWLLTKIAQHQTDNKIRINIPTINLTFNVTDEDVIGILNELPHCCYDDFDKWLPITAVLKTLKMQDLWDKWSQKSSNYNKKKNFDIWNKLQTKFDVNFLVFLVNKYGKNRKHFEASIHYKPIILPINTIYVDYQSIDYKLYDKAQTILLNSNTGIDKTTSVALYLKNNSNKKFISIVSDIYLANFQKEIFLKNGFNVKLCSDSNVNLFQDNIIIHINDLSRVSHSKCWGDHIVYLDEANSLFNYLDRDIYSASERFYVFHTLNCIISSAYKVIVTDTNINDTIIEYINTRKMKKTPLLIMNEYKFYKDIKAVEFNTIYAIVEHMKNLINFNKPFFATFDTLSQMKLIYEMVLDKDKENMFIFHYSGCVGDHNDWKNKFIFYTSPNIYDTNFIHLEPQEVFCFITGKTLGPLQIIHMITTNRKISKLNFYCPVKSKYLQYNAVDDVIDEYESNKYFYLDTFRKYSAVAIDEECNYNFYNNTFIMNHYYNILFNDVLKSNFRFSFINSLKKKGFLIGADNSDII